MEQNNFDLKSVKVHRTLEGTIFETAAAIIMVVTWAIAIATHQMDLDEVKGSFMGVIFGTIAVAVALIGAYFPSHINVANVKLENIRQVEWAIRMCRVLAIELALLILAIVSFGKNITDGPWMLIPVGIIIMTALFFTQVVRKAR